MKSGTHIEGSHWSAEYDEVTREIHVWRDTREVGTFRAPDALFGHGPASGAKSVSAHRADDAALRAFLQRLATDLSRRR
jgi:hypothetical protein